MGERVSFFLDITGVGCRGSNYQWQRVNKLSAGYIDTPLMMLHFTVVLQTWLLSL
jgi:hypothetical protein